MKIHFEKVIRTHLDIIFSWLAEPHIMEFWDNTQAHKDDIVNFTEGRKTPSTYCDGQMVYWIALLDNEPYAMFMTEQLTHRTIINKEKCKRLSKTGHTYGLDYMIGNPKFFGQGYGSQTLSDFIDFFRESIDPKADTFLIDPASDNPKAKHVYMKAGFTHACDFIMEGDVSGKGKVHHLLLRKFDPSILIINATMDDYPCIQNMARFYVYDISRECGSISSDWAIPENGLYECFDLKNYFEEASRKAYLVKVYDETAGFVLLDDEVKNSNNLINIPVGLQDAKLGAEVTRDLNVFELENPKEYSLYFEGFPAQKHLKVDVKSDAQVRILKSDWYMGEFFIIAKFQGVGIAHQVAKEIWNMHPGKWEVSVIPNNKSALKFWEKSISEFTYGTFNKQIKKVTYDKHCPRRIIFEFDTQNSIHKKTAPKFIICTPQLDLARKLIAENKNRLSFIIWIVTLIVIGGIIGSLTKPEISTWYSTLHRSSLTPPNYIFPVAWTVLYGIIGACGWLIWRKSSFPNLSVIKTLYVIQLILNWSWTPLFFHYHLTGLSLMVLGAMDILVGALIYLTYPKIRTVSLLMIPYFLWILFASYLNFYIWRCN